MQKYGAACPQCQGRGRRVSRAWLRARRLAAGLTQAEMGRQAGVSRAFVSQVEHGQRLPSTRVVRAYEAL
jgi:transcriptional regulator with XRE-family HTH domain